MSTAHKPETQTYLERHEIVDRDEASSLCEAVTKSLKDANYKVCAGALAATASAVLGAPDQFRGGILQGILPGVFDRLGDAKAPVRDAGRELFLALMSAGAVSPAELVGEASPAWRHKNWRVREETLRVVERAFSQLDREIEAGEVSLPVKAVVAVAARALEDREPAVREAAICAVVAADAAAAAAGGDVLRLLQKHTVRPGQMKEIQARLQGDEPTPVTKRVASPALGATRAQNAAAQNSGGRRPSTSGSTGSLASGLSGLRRTTSNASSATSGGTSSSLRRAGSLGTNAVSSASRAHATSLLARPATVAGGERPIARSLSGGIAPADPDDPPPYGRATGIVPRIAEGAPPRAAHVDSDRELSNEIDRVAERLDPKHEWTDRINAMMRVEALLLGGAAEWDAFPAQLAKLRGPLTAQVADRRSSIVRQAAHLLVILSAELGGEFEKEAAHFVPELFKCVVITVQIIAESGDHGIRGVLHNCQARQLVPRLCDAASKDRSVKLRCHATGWLRLVTREWDSLGGARNQECVEEALKVMVADGSPDVRAGARKLFSTYRERYPEGAARVAGRLDANTKRLIAQEAASGAHDDDELERAASALLARRPHTAATKTRATAADADRPSTVGASGGRRAGNALENALEARLPRKDARKETTTSLAERANRVGSVGGMATTASRAAAAAARRAAAIGGVSGVAGSRASGPGPGPGPGVGSSGTLASGASRVRSGTTLAEEASGRRGGAAASRESNRESRPASNGEAPSARRNRRERSASPETARPARPPTVSSALDAVSALGARGSPFSSSAGRRAAPASWEAKTAAFDALAAALRAGGRRCASEASSRAREMADAFVTHVGDPHHRVAHAVLEAMVEAVPATGLALEPELERLCPPLFPRLVDAKESVRGLASAALAAVGDAFPADAILPSLLASLEQAKAPRAKTGVLEFALYVLSGQGGGTRPGAATLSPASAGSPSLKKWVARVAPLVSDRHAPLRAAAAAGLAAVHARADPVAVLKHLAAMPLSEAAATCRAVAQHAPAVEREFHAYVAAERRAAERAAAEAEAEYAREAEYAARAGGDRSDAESLSEDPPPEEEEDDDAANAFSARDAALSHNSAAAANAEKALVERARRVREEQRRLEEEARRRAEIVLEEEEEARRREEEEAEARRNLSGAGFTRTGLVDSDASVSDDDVEIEHLASSSGLPESRFGSLADTGDAAAAKEEEEEKEKERLLETESAAVRAYRESRAAADASVERLAAARASLATAAPAPPSYEQTVLSVPKASPPPAPATPSVPFPTASSPAKPKSSPALEEALASLRERGPGDAASPGTRARALASIRRVLRGGAAVSAEEARVVVAAASRALARGGESHAGGPEPSAETKTHALFTLRDLARCSPESFAPHASTALPVILDALEDPEGVERDPEIALGAGDALDGVVDAIAPEAALRALAPRLKLTRTNATGVSLSQTQTRGSSFSAAPVRCVGGVVARMSGEALRDVAPEILPGLCEAFNSTSADVRKAVVDALVAMYDALGDWLLPRLAGLTAAQQKLLTIYINRAAERREKNAERDAEISARAGLKIGAPSGRVPLAPRPAQ